MRRNKSKNKRLFYPQVPCLSLAPQKKTAMMCFLELLRRTAAERAVHVGAKRYLKRAELIETQCIRILAPTVHAATFSPTLSRFVFAHMPFPS